MNKAAEFRSLQPSEQLNRLRGSRAEREFCVDRAGIDEKNRTTWLSIASARPYERWWGVEVLDVTKSAIRDERLRSGAALLVGHDPADQVGVIEKHEITSGGKLRILARFGKSARAEEVWQDVLDGIRRNTSVGYIIHDLVLEKQEGDVNTYRVTDWEPLEGSLVSVPADPSVGVGRSTLHLPKKPSERTNEMDTSEKEVETPAASDYLKRAASASKHEIAEALRCRELMAGGEAFANQGGREIARQVFAEGGTDQDFRRRMFDALGKSNSPKTITAQPADFGYGMGAREILSQPKYFTGADAQQRAYHAGMWFRAYLGRCIPRYRSDEAERFVRDHQLDRSMGEGVLTQGGALVPEALSPAIIDLAEKYGTFRQESDVYSMNSDTLSIPKSTGDPTASFVAESGALEESEGAWGSVTLSTKKIGTIIRVSTELVEDSVINVADRLAFQLGRAFAKKEDQCGFVGDGTSTYGGMSGVFTLLADSSHTASKVTAATNHDLFTEIDATDLSNLMAALPEYAHEGAKFYCSQVAWSLVFWRLMAAAGGNNASDMAGKVPKSYAGYPVVTNATLPAGASTDYTALTMLAFGNLRLASKFGARRDIRIQVLSEAYAAYDQIGVMGTERFDVVNHDCGDTSTAGPMVGLIGA